MVSRAFYRIKTQKHHVHGGATVPAAAIRNREDLEICEIQPYSRRNFHTAAYKIDSLIFTGYDMHILLPVNSFRNQKRIWAWMYFYMLI
jgi:hypothetical protein